MKRFSNFLLMGLLVVPGLISASETELRIKEAPPRVYILGDQVPVAVVSRKTLRQVIFTTVEPDKTGDAVVFPGDKNEFKMKIIGSNTVID